MHSTMSREVIKRLVVSIKQMETDLTFYENNWHLFRSPNFEYVPGLNDTFDKTVLAPIRPTSGSQASEKELKQPQRKPRKEPVRPFHSTYNFASDEAKKQEKPIESLCVSKSSSQVYRRKIYHHY